MAAIVQYTDWLEEEVGNMAREGLRTLVVAKKFLAEEQYLDFEVYSHYLCLILLNRSKKYFRMLHSWKFLNFNFSTNAFPYF